MLCFVVREDSLLCRVSSPFSIVVVYYYFTINLPNFNNPLVARGSEQKKGDRSRSTYYHFFLIAIGFIL